jgi:hypothetical protein
MNKNARECALYGIAIESDQIFVLSINSLYNTHKSFFSILFLYSATDVDNIADLIHEEITVCMHVCVSFLAHHNSKKIWLMVSSRSGVFLSFWLCSPVSQLVFWAICPLLYSTAHKWRRGETVSLLLSHFLTGKNIIPLLNQPCWTLGSGNSDNKFTELKFAVLYEQVCSLTGMA